MNTHTGDVNAFEKYTLWIYVYAEEEKMAGKRQSNMVSALYKYICMA